MQASRQYTIIPEPQKCTGCRRCQLICSFQHKGEFNPDEAYIVITEDDYRVNKITFTHDCDRCNICARYCVYGALKFERKV